RAVRLASRRPSELKASVPPTSSSSWMRPSVLPVAASRIATPSALATASCLWPGLRAGTVCDLKLRGQIASALSIFQSVATPPHELIVSSLSSPTKYACSNFLDQSFHSPIFQRRTVVASLPSSFAISTIFCSDPKFPSGKHAILVPEGERSTGVEPPG